MDPIAHGEKEPEETPPPAQHPRSTPGLYLVGTPIGNLEDITLRALRILKEADAVFSEDTRITKRLFDRHGIRSPLISCHQHNEAHRAEQIAGRIRGGQVVALVTDAGMPGVSDPGSRIAAHLHDSGLPVVAIPGACALVTALALSGLGGGGFSFGAFLPHKRGARMKRLAQLMSRPETVALYESPYRILKLLGEISSLDPARMVCVARELTKKFEETRRGTAPELLSHFEKHTPRGEFVVLIAPGEGIEVQAGPVEGDEDDPDGSDIPDPSEG